MLSSVSNRLIIVIAVLLSLVGMLDALSSDEGDYAAVLGAVTVALGVVLARMQWGRRDVAVRADIERWLRRRSAVTGERPEVIADRCIAACRDGLRNETRR